MNKPSTQGIAILCMIGAMLSYQASASFAKYLFNILDPTSITALRLTFATLIIFFVLRSWKIINHLKDLVWKDLISYGVSLGLMNLLFYHALHILPQGVAVGLEFVGPLGVALLAIQHRRDAIWVICAVIGVALFMPWSAEQNISWKGVLLALGAGVNWGLYIYFGQRLVRHNIGMQGLTLGLMIATVIFLPVGLWQSGEHVLNSHYWGHALGLAILATAIPYLLDLYALKSMSRLHYGTLTSLSPAVAAMMGMIFLHEYLSLIQWLAIAFIVTASVGVSLSKK